MPILSLNHHKRLGFSHFLLFQEAKLSPERLGETPSQGQPTRVQVPRCLAPPPPSPNTALLPLCPTARDRRAWWGLSMSQGLAHHEGRGRGRGWGGGQAGAGLSLPVTPSLACPPPKFLLTTQPTHGRLPEALIRGGRNGAEH